MTIGSERGSVQNPFLRYAEETGWTYLTPEQALDLRRGLTSPVLDSVLVDQLQRLNPGVVDHLRAEAMRDRLVRVRPGIEGNLDAWEFMKGLKTVFVESERRERNVRLIDFDNLDANLYHVTDELTFSNGTPPDIRTDLNFFINGIPILLGETKSSKKTEGIAEALDDIRGYHRDGPELLAVSQLHVLTHLIHFFYGATWNLSRKGLFNWRDEQAGDFETLVKTFVAPRRVLRIVRDFILFTRKDGELSKVVLRPHQMRAAERCVARCKEPKKRRALVWHTQGSGKTYTMLTVAKRLIEDPAFENPTVVMLVDRNELEAQLFRNLDELGIDYVVVESKRDLQRVLRADRRGLIVSMIHKFDDSDADLILRANVFVLVDEAHRTTGGDLGNYLDAALPNATWIGFTGTPIDKTAYGRGTFKTFGIDDQPQGYLDKYSIKESVADGTTVALHYQLAPNELRVDRETLEKEFFALAETEGVSDIEELNKVLQRAVTLRNMMKNAQRVEDVAEFVAKHFRETIEPMGYKAFLVAVDREACALYKEALDKHLPAEYSEVVISTQGKKDSERLRKFKLSEDQEKDIRKRFRKPDEQPKILIVTEKLLTGFDAPILYCMYLDKPLRDHVLLQAIARVNRPYEDQEGRRKTCGFVLDFVGIFDNLEKALAFDSQDVAGVIDDIDVLKERFAEQMEHGRREYLPIAAGRKGDKAVEAVLEHFRDKERRDELYGYFRELEELHEIISPDKFLRPFLKDYRTLADMVQMVRAAYERGISFDKSFLRKTEQLVKEHTATYGIQKPTKTVMLTPDALAAIADQDAPDTVKVFNLLKGQERDASQRSPEAFAVYWLLKKDGIAGAEEVAKAAEVAFAEHPHWQTSSQQEREVRKSLFKALIDAGVEAVVEIGESVLKMLRRAVS